MYRGDPLKSEVGSKPFDMEKVYENATFRGAEHIVDPTKAPSDLPCIGLIFSSPDARHLRNQTRSFAEEGAKLLTDKASAQIDFLSPRVGPASIFPRWRGFHLFTPAEHCWP
jgi:hypothetical protein